VLNISNKFLNTTEPRYLWH